MKDWTRRRLVGSLAALGCGSWEERPARVDHDLVRALRTLRPPDVARWLRGARRRTSGTSIVLAAFEVALQRCVETLDVHPMLLFGPVLRLDPDDDRLLLWLLLQITDWWEFSGCSERERVQAPIVEARKPFATVRQVDPHPTIWISEARFLGARAAGPSADHALRRAVDLAARTADPGRDELATRVLTTGRALAEAAPRSTTPRAVATWVLTQGTDVLTTLQRTPPSLEVLWQGLWLAAATAWTGVGGPLDPTHAITVLSAHQRLAGEGDPWASVAAVAAAARLAIDGATVRQGALGWDEVAASPVRRAWRARALAPGADVHDLKFCEAIANAPIRGDVFALVSGLAQRSQRLVEARWPDLDAAWATYRTTPR